MTMLRSARVQALEPDKIAALINLIDEDLGYQLHRSVQHVKCDLSRDEQAQFQFTDGSLEIEQRFQEVTGTLAGTGGMLDLQQGRLRGTRLSFTAGGRVWTGLVGDAAIAGENGAWTARRTG